MSFFNKKTFSLWLLLLFLAFPKELFAHCDGLDGPVVQAAQRALRTGNVKLVLIWVKKEDEPEIKEAFAQSLAVRKESPVAKELADRYFFETLVRVHRAGEGAPYTGLKPAGRDLGPAIPAADRALETGSLESLAKLLEETLQQELRENFQKAMAKKTYDKNDVAAGREFVESYVTFIHYVERLYEAAKSAPAGHFSEAEEASAHEENHR